MIVDPFSWETFLSDYWQQQPLLVTRQQPEFYADLFAGRDILQLPWTAAQLESSKYATDEQTRHMVNQPEELPVLYDRGFTLILKGADRFSAPLAVIAEKLRQTLEPHVFCSLFVTPPYAQALPAHWDDHDVFVLQLSGSKIWKFYAPLIELPLLESTFLTAASLPPLHSHVTIQPGDLLYCPRGWIHHVFNADESVPSTHVTISSQNDRWLRILSDGLILAALQDVELRRSVPIHGDVAAQLSSLLPRLLQSPCWAEALRQYQQRRTV